MIRSGKPVLFLVLLCLLPVHTLAEPVVDSDGRVIRTEPVCRRILSLYAAHTRNLLDLGLDQEIVATGRSDRQLADRPRVSFRDDPERLLALKPDLVLIRPMISRSAPMLVRRLESSGVRVVSLQPTDVNGMFRYWEILGRLTGREEEAAGMIARFGRELAAIRREVARIPGQERKRVYFEAIHSRMKTFAPSSMAIFVLEAAGGINVAADAGRVRNTNIAFYGKERILSKAGEIDVFLAQKGRMNPVTRETILREPGFQVIRAVREGRVFLVDERLVSRPTLGLLEGIRTVFGILYPERTLP